MFEAISNFLVDDLYGKGLPFVAILSLLVFVHEMGHYLIARWNRVRVEVFSIGFGKEIFGWTDKAKTRWKVSLIPLGGYVKFFGDADAASRPGEVAELSEEDAKESFHNKTLHQRAWVVAAGPLANFVLAIVLLAGLFWIEGQPQSPAVVGFVVEDSAAAAAGLEANDRILAIAGESVERFEEIQRVVALRPGQAVDILVDRAGQHLTLQATLGRRVTGEEDACARNEIGVLGIGRDRAEFKEHSAIGALWAGAKETLALARGTLGAVGQMFTGARSASELGGPLGIAEMSGQAAEAGFASVVWFAALLSINLGLINLFPVPILDGGHLLFYAIEAIRRKPLGPRAQEYCFRIGLALVLTLLVFATWNDLVCS